MKRVLLAGGLVVSIILPARAQTALDYGYYHEQMRQQRAAELQAQTDLLRAQTRQIEIQNDLLWQQQNQQIQARQDAEFQQIMRHRRARWTCTKIAHSDAGAAYVACLHQNGY